MFSTKKDIDRHVKTSLNKLPENERYLRGLAIARQYFKLNEYASAEHWLSCYLSVQEDSAPAHKLLGQCYEKQKKFDRAITSYQRSLQLDSKQTGLITDVCKLLLMDDNLTKQLSKAKHWCDLAESERINHEAVLNLKLKVANKNAGTDNKLVKDIILKEVLARPLDPLLRVRLVDHFLEEKKLDEAFKYCFELEMKFCEPFMQSSEWTNGVANMLTKYAETPIDAGAGKQKHWNYYLLQALVLDRQIYLNLLADSTMETIKRSNLKEIGQKLFKLDQTLQQVAEKGRNSAPQKQMADAYLRHYRGQLLLYSASLLFKAAQDQSSSGRARDTTKKCLALLLMAYQCGVPDSDEPWLKQSSEMARQLLGFWNKQAAFRCCQAGSTLLSCVEDGMDVSVLAQIQSVTETKVWTTADDLVNQIRQLCSDPGWRQSVARTLYSSGDISSKATSSGYFVKDGVAFGEPQYVLPKREQLELYVELAQSLYPSSLPYLVYLGLVIGTENLSDFHCKAFPRLNFSTNNLNNCNLETLNQLDMDSFLYCCILIAQSNLDNSRQINQQQGRPAFLPAANLTPLLCEDNKIDWWSVSYNLIKSSTAKDAAASVAEQRQLLEHGLQAIRGTDAPLCDVMVLLKLGQVLAKRAAAASTLIKAEERRYVETRAEAVYRAGVLLWKMRHESSYGGGMDTHGGSTTGYGSGLFFKYAVKSYDCQQELAKLAESAITFLAGVYFKHSRYEEFTQDFGGIPLPFAAYFRAEAFKKLDEQNKTPLKAKKFYSERARECIRQTQRYLELPYVERNHPLNYVVQSEMKRLSFTNDSFDGSLNTSANGATGASGDDSDHFQSFTSSMTNPGMASGGGGGTGGAALSRNIAERDAGTAAATAAASMCLAKTTDLEALIRQMMETLTFVKEDVLGIRNDVGDMQDRLVKIEENIYRKPTETKGGNTATTSTPVVNDSASVSAAAAAAAMQAMNDMYMMDEFQSSASALAYQHAAAAAAAAVRTPVMGGVGMGAPQQPGSAIPYHALYGANAYPSYMPGPIQQHQPQQQQQQQQMLTPRGHPMTGAMGASPMHTAVYQHHPDSLLVAAGGSPAAGGYHLPAFQQAAPPPAAPQPEPQGTSMMHSAPIVSQMTTPASTIVPKSGTNANLSIEQSLQTPALLSSWNSTYNNSFSAQTSAPSVSNILPAHITSSVESKGGAPVNVVITSSDPLPPPPSVNSSTFAAGSTVQPTYSVTIPPQHIKHSNTGASIAQGTTGNNTPKLEMISPAANTKFPMPSIVSSGGLGNNKPVAAVPAASAASLTPSFFANMVSPAKLANDANQVDEEDDDEDKNVSGSAEYDPRPDFQPIIPLPDEIVVRTGEEDEEQIFTGRSKLLRLVDREWKERGLGDLKILRSKADRSKYRIVMRREQVHKICANHYITPELIIKPMEKRKECFIWAAMDFADEQPRKESFCARFGTAALANEFYNAFVAARDEVTRLRAESGEQQSSTPAAPPPTTMGSFAYSSTPKSSAASTPASSAAAPVQSQGTAKPFGEFTFSKTYTPPPVSTKKAPKDNTPSSTGQGSTSTDGKPSPFASFTFKAQTQGGSASSPFGNIFGGATGAGASLGSEERDFTCTYEANVVGLKRKEQKSGMWIDCGINNGQLRLLTSKTAVRLQMRHSERPSTVYLNHVLSQDLQIKATDKTACSWTVHQDALYPSVTGLLSFMAQFKTADERDLFVAAVQNAVPSAKSGAKATGVAKAPTESGFGDLFKPKSGSWDCPGCYVNNKADMNKCVACSGPRDPSKKEDQKPSLTGGLFGNLAPPTEGASKFTFGMPTSSVTITPISFGTAATGGTKKPQEQPAKPAPVTKGATTTGGGGFGDQFKPKPGSWTCNDCYLSNSADALYCMSCESPKDDTVSKKSASGGTSTGGLLKGADTMPKMSFAAGGGFTFALPSSTTITPATGPSIASTATSTITTSAGGLSQPQQQPAFGGGFSFGSPMKPPQSSANTVTTTTGTSAAATTATTLEKPVFKFELPTPAGGLSFGSKLTSNTVTTKAADGPSSTPSSAISKLDPPEKATFGFVFKPKSPGRTLSGDGEGADDDGNAGDNSVTEEENNTYFAPVIPLPDKIDVKTGEEDEHVLYAHRAKLYRFVSSEWKERGIGDVKILKHKGTDKLRVVMRREQVLKICLNHALTEDICYTKKDDKSWQFVANDFSEGNFEIMNFCLRFKSADIAQEFRDAITDALSGKLNVPVEGKDAPSKVTSPSQNDITITSTSSPVGDLNFSKLSDISLNDRETAQKLKLPDNFFDSAVTPCAGCRGCDSDAFVFPTVDANQLVGETDEAPLPIDIKSVRPPPPPVATSSSPKKVTFGTAVSAGPTQATMPLFGGNSATAKPEPTAGMFSGIAFKASPTTAASTTTSFLSAEQKASPSPFMSATSIFGATQLPSSTVVDQTVTKFAFGSKLIFPPIPQDYSMPDGPFDSFNLGATSLGSTATGGSIFSASLNTTPKTSFVSPPSSTVAASTGGQVTSTTDSKTDTANPIPGPNATTGSSPLLQPASLTTPPSVKSAESGGKLFGSGFGSGGGGFGSAGSTNIFGGGNIFGSNTNTANSTTVSNSSNSSTPTIATGGANSSTLFGSVAFGDVGKSTSVFGGSGFTFGSLAKQSTLTPTSGSNTSNTLKNNSDAPSMFKIDDSVSFATLASSNSPAFSSSTKQPEDGATKPGGGFVGLTVKEDFFSRSASAKLNSSTDGNSSQTNNNGIGDDAAAGGGEDGGAAAAGDDENYDPYYAPVIQLPDEIKVRTGEEEETKLFGERAKLYRFDSATKEWKERGIGELKILHHPVRNTYRVLLRREQIFKLVLNHAITADLSVTPMNNSDKAFAWGAMNHAETPGQLEQLAVRFKNEGIASEFRSMLEKCQEQLRSRPDLEPDQD
uniref:E3 SUMO-protein ligase RanBP2 n=1 Tax=Anopheles christyi TaxID=43041 RepID=A0A182JQ05_9DIPT